MRSSLALLASLGLLSGCKKPEAPPGPKTFAGTTATAQAPETGNAVKGKVLERLDAPPYSYLRLGTASGESWAAVTQTETKVGAEVTVNGFPMKDFESKTLNRKFELVYFGSLAGEGPPPGAAPAPAQAAPAMGGPAPEMTSPGAMAAQHQTAGAGPSEVKIAKVAKAAGPDGRNVEEIWTQKEALKEKSVTVRGQVVKLTPGVMGRNWLHLRDGSGTADKKNNDITVTTQDEAMVGDLVTVKGMVRLDKDFGAGYAYPVIIEEAKVSKK